MPRSSYGGPQLRVSSPAPGRSTLMTSAPRSASTIVASGPARIREKSAIRMPATASAIARSGPYVDVGQHAPLLVVVDRAVEDVVPGGPHGELETGGLARLDLG